MAVCELSGDHPREKIMKTEKKKDKKVFLIAQELKLARVLAGNNKTSRDKALKNLKKWFSHRSKTLPFTDNDFQIIWKGLYFSMWMSDKPLIQEECAENIASLIHFLTLDESLLFFKAGLTILINEWFGIDQLRLDKFFMLVRRLLRQMLVELKKHDLSKKNIDKFNEVVSFTVLNTDIHPPVGLFMHFTEIFLEELAKVTKGNVASERLVDFIEPFIKKLSSTSDGREIVHLKKFIFIHLIKQSNLGLDYQDKYEAWKREGFPGSINSMQKLKLDKGNGTKNNENFEETDDKPLDPRAGRVDVDLPQLKFKAKDVVNALTKYKFDKGSNTKSRRNITELIYLFTKMSKGVYPLGVKKVLGDKESYDDNVRKAANRLIKFEKKLLGKEKKKRKRISENDDEKADVPEKRRKVENSKLEDPDKISGNGDSSGKDSREKKKKKADLPKKQKIVDHSNQDMDKQEATNGDNVSEKKLKNRKVVKTKHDRNERNQVNALVKGDVDYDKFDKLTQKRLVEFIEQSEGGVNRKIKKRMKEVEIPSKKVEGTSNKKGQTAKRKRRNEISNDQKEMKKKRKNKKENEIIDNIECVFERNSGTWIVFDISKERDNLKIPSQQTGAKKGDSVVSSSSNHKNANTCGNSEAPSAFSEQSNALGGGLGSPKAANEASSKNTTSPVTNFSAEEGSPKSGLSPVRLFESPRNATELFPKFAWDEPLQEGEYEICVPSKKHVAKLKRQAKKQNQNVHELINTSMKQLRGKGRHSLDLNLAKNQFSTPNSAKKVKINTKLNRSQEIHEHVQQILSSPGIPYDANKKPSKPLLKTSATSTPVNPFYNKQLNVW